MSCGGVKNLQPLLVRHQREEERLRVDALGELSTTARFLCARHLHETEQRI